MGDRMETNKINKVVLAYSLAAIVSVELITGLILSKGNFLLIQGTARIIDIALILMIVHFRGDGFPSIGLAPDRLFKGTVKGLIWSAGFGVITITGFSILFAAGINPFKLLHGNLPSEPVEIFLFFFVAALIAPIAEELFFRGILYGFFRRWGVVIAIMISTAIFVAMHSFSGIPVTQIVGGILFSIAYEIEKNLMVPILIHVIGNTAIFSISLLPF